MKKPKIGKTWDYEKLTLRQHINTLEVQIAYLEGAKAGAQFRLLELIHEGRPKHGNEEQSG